MKKRLLSILLCLALLAGTTVAQISATADSSVWDGSSVSTSLSGAGTAISPYLIKSAADLKYFADQVNGGNDYSSKVIYLDTDIDLNNHPFAPIGNTGKYFRGQFDGKNHTVKGANISNNLGTGTGFFGALHNGWIKNLHVEGSVICTLDAANYVGGLVGFTSGNITIYNCSFDGLVRSANTNANRGYCGGLVGFVDACTVGTNIVCSYSSGVVDVFGRAGGLVGGLNNNSEYKLNIKDSYSDATVTGSSAGTSTFEATGTAGGLLGFLQNGTITMTNCFFAGKAPSKRSSGYAGPIINHKAGGTLTLTRVFFDNEKNTLASGASFAATVDGTGQTTADMTSAVWENMPTTFIAGDATVKHPQLRIADMGKGTKDEPYVIDSKDDLQYFSYICGYGGLNVYNFRDDYIELGADIDMSSVAAFTPIGSTNMYFRGNFDGKGHTVSDVTVKMNTTAGVGFFGAAGGITITNLNVTGTITNNYRPGGAVAGILGKSSDTVYITNCSFDGTVYSANTLVSTGSGYSPNDMNYLSASGLICDIGGNAVIDRCSVSGIIDGFGRSGGLIGSVNSNVTVTVTNSYCDATVTGKGPVADSLSNFYTAGGLVGFLNTGTIMLTNCFFAGTAPAKRVTNGMAGPVINHKAGGTLTLTNVYYNSDNASLLSGASFNESVDGIGKTSAEFADETVTDLLNTGEEVIFVQGATHPILTISNCEHTDVSAVWLSDDTNHWRICNTCGRKIDKGIHTSSDWIIDEVATELKDGSMHKGCSVCGKVLQSDTYYYDGWDGTVSDALTGEGTSKNPYIIKTGADLAYLSEQVNSGNNFSGKYISLANDIRLNNFSFTPIGNNTNYFRGTLNGNNYTVSGLNIVSDKTNGIGFFGGLAGVAENLNIKGSVVATAPKAAVAGLAGVVAGAAIRHCSFDGTVYSPNTTVDANYYTASGLVSLVQGSLTVDQCYVSGTVDGYGRGGGLVGVVNGGFTVNILNSYCDADVLGIGATDGSNPTSGGLIGFLNAGSISVTNSFFAGTAPAKRSSGFAGPVINHKASGTLTLTNVFYNSDKNAPNAGASYNESEDGIGKTSDEFNNGNVLTLLNNDPMNPVFVSAPSLGHPALSAKYVKKVNLVLKNYTFEDHPGTVEQYDTDVTRYTDDGFFKNTDSGKLVTDPDYYYIGARLFNYGAWNNSKIHIPQKEFANNSEYGVGFTLAGGATFVPISKTDIDPELFYTFTVDAKVIKTVSDAAVQIGLFRPNTASGTLAFQDSDGNTYDTAIKAVKVKLDKTTDYATYKIEISGEEILDFCSEYSYSANSLYFGVYCPTYINKTKDEYTAHCMALDNFKATQSAVPDGYVPMASVAATDILDESLTKSYGEHLYNYIANPSFENALEGVWANLPAGFTVKTASGNSAIFGSKYLSASGPAKISVPVNLVKNKFYTFGISVRGAKGSSYKIYLSDAPGGAPLPDVDGDSQKFLISADGTGKTARYGIYFRNTMKTGTTLYVVLESVTGTVDFDEITLTNKTGWEKNKNYYPKASGNQVSVYDALTGSEKTVTIPSGKTVYDVVK